jgi:hypothetical protein
LATGADNFLTHAVRGFSAGSGLAPGVAVELPLCWTPRARSRKRDVLRKALGNTGTEDDVDYFVRVKQVEFQEWQERVSDWEIDRYLQLF